jgi:predicted DsbA family dithiol-disulfide isomerase
VLTRLVDEYDLAFEWRGFELHPDTPRGGMRVADYIPAARTPQAIARMKQFATSFGVTMELPERSPNTRRALAVAEYARDQGRLDPFRTAAMEAHWNGGADIEADDVLARLAKDVGLDPVEALAAADGSPYVERVDAMGEEAARWGVTGIPTYFLLPRGWTPGDSLPPKGEPRPVRIVGCQPYETVEQGCALAGVARRGG